MAKTIAIVNQKGGVGKTTTCVNLAAALTEAGQRVLLCDFDPQANSTSGMGVDKTVSKGVYDALIGEIPVEDAVVHTKYGDVLPSNKALAGAGVELIAMDRREFLLKDALARLKDRYDFLFIDCPPSLELLTLNALCAADSILVPVQGEYYALEGLSDLMNTVRIVRRSLNPQLEMDGGIYDDVVVWKQGLTGLYRVQYEEMYPREPDEAIRFVDEKLTPFKPQFIREVTRNDILKLMEIKMQRILKFNKDKADELIARIKQEIAEIERDLAHMTEVTINWYEYLKQKYGKDHPRRTEIRNFDTIEVTKVVEANRKLYINRQEGFVGTGLKKDELVCNCSDLDDIIIFYRDGKFKVTKVAEKIFVGKNILHVQVFKKNDTRTIYNCVYRDGKMGPYYIKRFNITAMTRDKMYDLTQGKPGSRVVYFTANPNGEAEIIKVTLEPDPKRKKQNIFMEKDFSEVLIKGRAAKGNLLTRKNIHRIGLKSHGHSTLGGRKVWFDPDVNRINYEEHGRFLGEFSDTESILVVLDNGEFYVTNFDANNHYEPNILRLEKWDEAKVWTAVLHDADNGGMPYLKRFTMDATKRHQNFLGENPNSRLILLTDEVYPRILITYGGADALRPQEEIDAESFVGQKSFKAKGKRLTNWTVERIEELEPLRHPEPEEQADEPAEGTSTPQEEENLDPDKGKSQQQVIDEITGQLSLFSDEDLK